MTDIEQTIAIHNEVADVRAQELATAWAHVVRPAPQSDYDIVTQVRAQQQRERAERGLA